MVPETIGGGGGWVGGGGGCHPPAGSILPRTAVSAWVKALSAQSDTFAVLWDVDWLVAVIIGEIDVTRMKRPHSNLMGTLPGHRAIRTHPSS